MKGLRILEFHLKNSYLDARYVNVIWLVYMYRTVPPELSIVVQSLIPRNDGAHRKFFRKPSRAIMTDVRLTSGHTLFAPGEKKKKYDRPRRGASTFSPFRRGHSSSHNYATHVRPCRGNMGNTCCWTRKTRR